MNNIKVLNNEFKTILEKRGMLSNKMSSEISDSWTRCILEGLNPFKEPKKKVISIQELDIHENGFTSSHGVACALASPKMRIL